MLQEYGQDGSFLIRPSQTTVNSYTLSVRCGDDFKHVKIQNNGDCYEIGEGGDKFATLAELVEHFIMKESLRDKSDGTVLVLRYPLSYKEPTTERYFHGAISGAEATNLLMTKGKPGSYLVRESRTHPEDYVLCVRCDNDKIVHLIIQYTVSRGSSGEPRVPNFFLVNLSASFSRKDTTCRTLINIRPRSTSSSTSASRCAPLLT